MTHQAGRVENVDLPILNIKGESLGMSIGAYDRARPQNSTERIHALCLAPFTAVDFGPDGTITVCNHYNHWIARIEEHESFLDVWRGPEFQKLRDNMREYVLDEDRCRHCARHIRSGMPTQTFATLQFDTYPPTSTHPEFPEYLIFRLSNNCNLACVMCDEYFSSVIREKREELPPIKRYYGDRFFEDIKRVLPTARYVEFYGGEPFLVPEHRRVFELIEETGSQCGIYVNTNGTSLNARSKHWLETLNFKVIAVSMDASNAKLHSRTRIGIVHQVLHQNFRWLLELRQRKGISLSINVTELRQNWFDLPQMFRFAASVDCGVHINTCVSPPHCSLYTLPTDQLQFVNDYLKREKDRLGSVLDVRGNHESYSLLLQMIDEELNRRGPEALLPIEVSVCQDRYGTKGLLAAPIPGEAPFDTPEAVAEEIDRLIAAKLTCEERLLSDMLEDMVDLADSDRWRDVRRRLEELCCDSFVEFFPIDRDARALKPILSAAQAADRLKQRYGSQMIDTVAVDSNGRLVNDTCCSSSFLGVPLEPLWGRPLVDLHRELRRLIGRTSRAWEINTPAFSEKLATCSDSPRAIGSVTILRWNSRRQIDGNVFVATFTQGETPAAPILTGLFTEIEEERDPNANRVLAERAMQLMRALSSDGHVLRIDADDKEIVSKVSGELDDQPPVEGTTWVGRRVDELFAHLDCDSPPSVLERYWRPFLFNRVAHSSTSNIGTRLLTLPQFNASGRVCGSVTLLFRIKNGVGLLRRFKRQEKASFIDIYTPLVLRQFSTTKTSEMHLALTRVLSQRRRVHPDAEIRTIWTDFRGVIVSGPDESWFTTWIRDYVGKPWDELFNQVTESWGESTVEIDDSEHFRRHLFRFRIGNEERVIEQLIFTREDSANQIGSTIVVVASSTPARTELCVQFEERQYLGHLPANAMLSESQALAALSENGGQPLVRFRVDPRDTVLSVQSLENESPRVDFSSAAGSHVTSIHIRLVETFGTNVITVDERNEAGFKDCVLRFLNNGSKSALLRVIQVPRWAENGSVESVEVFMGFVSPDE